MSTINLVIVLLYLSFLIAEETFFIGNRIIELMLKLILIAHISSALFMNMSLVIFV